MTTPDPHREQRERLGAYALGHLDAAEALALRAHLDGCASCRGELADIVGVLPGLADLDVRVLGGPASPPPGLGEAIAVAVRHERVLRDRRRARGRVLAVAAAVAAVLGLVGVGVAAGRSSGAAPVAAPVVAPSPTPAVPMEPVRLVSDVAGVTVTSAVLVPHTWGVELRFAASGLGQGARYHAVFRSRDGAVRPAGEFFGIGAKPVRCDMQAALLRRDTARFQVYDAADRPVLDAVLTG